MIEELKERHLEAASEMFAAAYSRQREIVPALDESFVSAASVLPKLRSCLDRGYGVAATENGALVGFMAGFQIEVFLGPHRGVYIPEWAHGSVDGNAFEIYRAMYRSLGQTWLGDRCLTHAINFLDHAAEAREAFVWNGFGGICFDAIRPVERMGAGPPDGVAISSLGEKDIPAWLPLVEASARHLARSPSFLPHLEPEKPEKLRSFLEQPGNLAWMAWSGDEPAGYMQVTPVGNGAAWVVNGEKKFAINGAYVRPDYRGKGIATALLSAIMSWGAENGFERCTVDFEATNLDACHFWLRHFRPVCRSYVRRVDERVLKSI